MFYKEVQREKKDYYGNTKIVTEKVLDTKKVGFTIGCVVLCFILFILSCCCVCKVPTGHTGIITTFGKVANYTYDAGLHLKAPWQNVTKMDNRVQKNSLELACFSSDIQEVNLVYTVNYQIDDKNAMNIYRTIGKDYYEITVMPTIAETVKVVTARYTAENLVGQRNVLAEAIEEELTGKLQNFNINVVSTSIEDMDFTDAFTNAVEEKQVAEQNKLKAQTEAEQKVIEAKANADVAREKAQGEADAKRIAAEAEAEANKKISESLDENVLKNKWYEKWDGKYPTVVSDSGTIIEFPLNDTTEN